MNRLVTLGIYFFGAAEIAIGIFSLANIISNGLFAEQRFIFILVVLMSLVSFILGLGIIFNKEKARKLLLLFSIMVMINKALVFSGFAHFPKILELTVSERAKDIISFAYHLSIVVFFSKRRVIERFINLERD